MRVLKACLVAALISCQLPAPPVAARVSAAQPLIAFKIFTPCTVCAGAVIYYNDTIDASGLVTPLVRSKYAKKFRLNPSEFAEFRRVLGVIRPQGYRRIDEVCPKDADSKAKPDDIDISWYDEPQAHLTSCFGTPSVTEAAMAAVRILQTADPLVSR